MDGFLTQELLDEGFVLEDFDGMNPFEVSAQLGAEGLL
ncbi:hypothetical protein N806_29760 [Rhodococcus sp. P27]|nr:hypothetical protein N806_29760 [Rhodococcus sp. P27]